MNADTRHVHIHLGDLGDATEIHLHLAPGSPPPAAADGDTPEAAMLRRMKAYGTNGSNVQAVHDGLIALGLVPHISVVRDPSHTPQAYLRFTRGDPGPTVLYLNTASVQIMRAGNLDKIGSLPGAAIRRDTVFFRITTPAEVAQALAAVKAALA